MIDIHFLISHVPAILDAEAVVIVHGERHNDARSAGPTPAPPTQALEAALPCRRMHRCFLHQHAPRHAARMI